MGEQAKTIEYRFGDARPHEARSMTRRGNEARQTTMRLRRAMKNPIPATKNESSPMDCFFVFGCNEAHLRCIKRVA